MRVFFRVLVLATLLPALCPAPAQTEAAGAGDGAWGSPPKGARLVLLLTGSDRGYVEPKACWGVHGGTLYRPAFATWHDERFPELERLWAGAGLLLATPDDRDVVSDTQMWAHLARIGYAALTPGAGDLERAGPFALLRAREEWGLPFVATNLRRHETGETVFDASVTLETAAGRVLFLGVVPERAGQLWFSPEQGTIVVTDPVQAIRDELEASGSGADIVVLLSSLSQQQLRRVLASLEGEVDLVAASDGLYATRTLREVEGHHVLWLGAWGHVLGRAWVGEAGRLIGADTVEVRGAFPVDAFSGRPVDAGGPVASGH